MTFGVVVRAPVPNGRMSDPFPCGSWPYHSVPDGLRGIRYSSSGSTPRFTLADLQVGPGLCALSFCVGRYRGGKGMRRGGEQDNYIFAFPSMR
nr:orf116 [Ipomoea batatas]